MHSKKIILSGLLLISIGLVGAQETSLSVENGLEMTSDQFYYNGQGGSPILTYDSSNNRWIFEDPAALSDINQSDSGATALNLNSANNLYLNRKGGVMNGTLDLDGNSIQNVGDLSGTAIVNSNQLADGSVGSPKIALNAVGTDQLDETQSYNLDWSNLAISQSDVEGTDIQNLSEVLSEGNDAGANDIDLSGNSVTGLPTNQDPSDAGTSTSDAVSIGSAQDLFLTSSGAVMSGSLDMDGNSILNVPTPTSSQEAANKAYVDSNTGASGLSEVLEQNNVANQSIEFSNGIKIGDSTVINNESLAIGRGAQATGGEDTFDGYGNETAVGTNSTASGYISSGFGADAVASGVRGTAIGHNSQAKGDYSLAVGQNSLASSSSSTALGQNARATVSSATAVGQGSTAQAQRSTSTGFNSDASGISSISTGYNSEAIGDGSVAIGSDLESTFSSSGAAAQSEGSVAIGANSISPNSYEATFGNLQGQELDLNVTGNATIHGSGGLDMPNGIVIGNQASVNSDDAVQGIAIGDSSSADAGGSSGEGLAIGVSSSATDTYATALGSSSSASSYSGLAIGFGSQASGNSANALGRDTNAGGGYSSALGWRSETSGQFSTAIGPDSDNSGAGASAGGTGSVAIGADSVSNSDYTARFGSGSQPYDVEVTGNLTVDGELQGVSTGGNTEGLSETLTAGNVANQTVEFDSSTGVQIGDGSTSTVLSSDVAVGNSALAQGTGSTTSVAVGSGSAAEGAGSVALGNSADASGSTGSIAIGNGVTSTESDSISIGTSSTAGGMGSTAIGVSSVSNQDYTARFGSDSQAYDVNITGDLGMEGGNIDNVQNITTNSDSCIGQYCG